MKRMAAACAFLVLSVATQATAWAATCNVLAGERIVLESDAVDPDVFIWDSRARLVDYAAGQWGSTRAIFAHTVLAAPGTQATVVSCTAGIARRRFANGDEDAIGVKILSGSHRGRYGWVLSSDIHLRGSGAAPSAAMNPRRDLK